MIRLLPFFPGCDVRSQLANALRQDGDDAPAFLRGHLKDASGAQVPDSGDRTWEKAAKAVKELRARMHTGENARKRKVDSSVELDDAELEELE